MREFDEDIEFNLPIDQPLYIISIVSKLVDIPVWTLRELEKKGVVKPKRLGKKARLYSLKQVKKLEYVHYLMSEERVNISGIRYIFEMREEK